jgi:hypothetical protein
MDFDSPEGRLAALEQLGPEAYNARMRKHQMEQIVETVNGYDIRKIPTRFGALFQVGTTSEAFPSIEAARECARKLEPRR